jgi:heat shock protein HslJ
MLRAKIIAGGVVRFDTGPVAVTFVNGVADAGEIVAKGVGGSQAQAEKLSARGHEPSWSLSIDGDKARLALIGEAPLDFSILSRSRAGGVLRIAARAGEKDMAVGIGGRLCSDTMTGMPFPLTVTLDWQGRRMTGCGGETRSVLEGGWIVREINGKPITARTPEGRITVTLAFDGEGRINGKGGCNRYMGGYELTPERLTFKPAAASMMMCPPPAMEIEQAFFAALPSVTGVRADGAARLVLTQADGAPALLLVRGP